MSLKEQESLDKANPKTYNRLVKTKEVNKMARKKKKGGKDNTLEKLVLATAILNLIKALIDLISELTG